MCDEKLHGLLYPGPERILTSQQQQQLGRGQLQQHACDFTGKRLRRQTHSWVKYTDGNHQYLHLSRLVAIHIVKQ